LPPPLHSPEDAPAIGPARFTLVGLAFLASGAAALVYQVVWQRILALHTGMGITSIALIVSAFMAGLGLGSHAGGVLSARVEPPLALRLFAAIEILVGLFASLSCRLYYDVPERFLPGLYGSTLGMGFAHFLALVVPTFLMGMSLPFLVRAMVRDTATASRTIGTLYGINVLGASLGALVTPWLLIRFQGMEGAVLWGVAGNALAGSAALLAGVGAKRAGTPPEAAPVASAAPLFDPASSSLELWAVLYALSGFTALALEILWFRLIDVSVKSTAFTFGTVLCVYLLGLGTGSLLGAWNAARFRRPLRAFLLIQCLLLLYSSLAVAALARLPKAAPGYRWFFGYWAQDAFFQLGADWNLATLLRLYLLLPMALYGPPTVLMGLAFTALQRAVQDDPRTSGRKVGLLQAANIAGCVAGSLLVGLLLLDRLGTTGSLRLLLVLGLVFLAVLARHAGPRAALPWVIALALAFLALPGQDALWTRLHGVTDEARPSFIGEDASAVSAVTPGQPGHWRVTVNGLPHSWIPFEGLHTLLGAVPAIVHPEPSEVAVIGLGSGETAWAVACRSQTRSVEVFEIAGAQPRLLQALAAATGAPDLQRFLSDPRMRIEVADGRHALLRTEKRYDLIQVDALYRTSAMSGTLYSVEFFRLCARRLKPGGILCTQAPGRRTALSLAAAVPHGLDLGNIVIGSNDPLPVDLPAWRARLAAVTDYFGAEVAEGIRDRLTEARPLVGNPHSRRGLNDDLFPRDEFSTPAKDVGPRD